MGVKYARDWLDKRVTNTYRFENSLLGPVASKDGEPAPIGILLAELFVLFITPFV